MKNLLCGTDLQQFYLVRSMSEIMYLRSLLTGGILRSQAMIGVTSCLAAEFARGIGLKEQVGEAPVRRCSIERHLY